MAVSALAWGVGVPMAAQATDSAYSDFLPSPVESAALGLMLRRHDQGLQSGGLVGFRSFFTGYNESSSALSALSPGRAAGRMVALAARGLQNTSMAATDWGAKWLPRLSHFDEFGLQGVMSAVDASDYDRTLNEIKRTRYHRSDPLGGFERSVAGRLGKPWSNVGDFLGHTNYERPFSQQWIKENARGSMKQAHVVDNTRMLQDAGYRIEPIKHNADDAARSLAARTHLEKSGPFRALSLLSGRGRTADGTVSGRMRRRGDLYFAEATGKSGPVWKSSAGRIIGKGFRLAAGIEIATMAAMATADYAGSAYASLNRLNSHLNDRLGVGTGRMSQGYYNRATATERQRAVAELNRSVLNPRTQLQGNEAAMMHR